MKPQSLRAVALKHSFTAIALAAAYWNNANALAIAPISTATGIETTLSTALLAPSSGIAIVGGSASYQGTNSATVQQSGTYSGFNLAPSSGSTPTLTLANGIVLTSGSANIPLSNTLAEFTNVPDSGSNATLSALIGESTFDANALSFNFNVTANQTSISAQFVFGTDEFPTEQVTDIFGFFVDGVNYAKFAGGELISNTPGNPTNFIANPLGAGLYGIEYNGLTRVFTVTGLLGTANADGSHRLTIGIADTTDTRFDSAVFITSLTSGTATGGGGIGDTPGVPAIPEPETYALMMVGLGLLGVVARRRGRT
jgi:hypothetical protein